MIYLPTSIHRFGTSVFLFYFLVLYSKREYFSNEGYLYMILTSIYNIDVFPLMLWKYTCLGQFITKEYSLCSSLNDI